jgi:aspartate racemase
MGPLVSAEFLKTIYSAGAWQREQDAPNVIVFSDPSFPDRTELLLRGEEEPLVERLEDAVTRLVGAGATSVVVACVTIHRVLDRLPPHLRRHVVSLIDTTLEAVAASDERHLMLCTTGTRHLGLFESHPLWESVRDRVVMPSEEDQTTVHALIYQIKSRRDEQVLPVIGGLLRRYAVRSMIAGCTEMHLAARTLASAGDAVRCIDPLTIVARAVAATGDLRLGTAAGRLTAPDGEPSYSRG